jgi:hypothetical protein
MGEDQKFGDPVAETAARMLRNNITPKKPRASFWAQFPLEEIIVFVTGELIALPFCFEGTGAFMKGDWENTWKGFGIGIPIAIAGLTFRIWKNWISDSLRQWILTDAKRWWPLALMLAFAYAVGPDLYRRSTAMTSASVPDSHTTVIVSTTAAPTMPPLSDEEKQFRHDLRAFVKATLAEQNAALWQLAYQTSSNNTNDLKGHQRDVLEALELMFHRVLDLLMANTFQDLTKDVDNDIDAIDERKVVHDLKAYMQVFLDCEGSYLDFITISGINPTKGELQTRWLDADARADQVFAELKASPIAKAVGLSEVNGFAVSPIEKRFRAYLLQAAPDQPQAK